MYILNFRRKHYYLPWDHPCAAPNCDITIHKSEPHKIYCSARCRDRAKDNLRRLREKFRAKRNVDWHYRRERSDGTLEEFKERYRRTAQLCYHCGEWSEDNDFSKAVSCDHCPYREPHEAIFAERQYQAEFDPLAEHLKTTLGEDETDPWGLLDYQRMLALWDKEFYPPPEAGYFPHELKFSI